MESFQKKKKLIVKIFDALWKNKTNVPLLKHMEVALQCSEDLYQGGLSGIRID